MFSFFDCDYFCIITLKCQPERIEGLKALPKGIYYKVLAEGNAQSATPSVRSIVSAHYTGRTINGKTFDSSRGGVPLACRLRSGAW